MEQYDDMGELMWDGNNLGFVLEERGQGMPDFIGRFTAALNSECESEHLLFPFVSNPHQV